MSGGNAPTRAATLAVTLCRMSTSSWDIVTSRHGISHTPILKHAILVIPSGVAQPPMPTFVLRWSINDGNPTILRTPRQRRTLLTVPLIKVRPSGTLPHHYLRTRRLSSQRQRIPNRMNRRNAGGRASLPNISNSRSLHLDVVGQRTDSKGHHPPLGSMEPTVATNPRDTATARMHQRPSPINVTC